jgi:hypothetical protein
VLVVSALVTLPVVAAARLVPCDDHADTGSIAAALTAIERSVDPCGESADVRAMLEILKRCAAASYQICTDSTIPRNVFDRPTAFQNSDRRTITWNPGLRSELEPGCDAGTGAPVLRDPTASLVHELAHATQDCTGLNPGEHELEAVRIENIYRRAAGLPQRRGYGEDPLPREMVRTCTPTECSCAGADGVTHARARLQPAGADVSPGPIESSGDSVSPASVH